MFVKNNVAGGFNIEELEKLYEVSALGELNDTSEEVLTSFKYGVVHGGIYEACKDIQGIEQLYKKSKTLSNDIYDISPCFSKLTEEIKINNRQKISSNSHAITT
jgi:hypothetical protein